MKWILHCLKLLHLRLDILPKSGMKLKLNLGSVVERSDGSSDTFTQKSCP